MFRKKNKNPNRRRYLRIPAYFLIKYRPEKENAQYSIANVKDIGRGGIKFWSDQKLPEKSLIQLSLCVPPLGKIFEVSARVLRVQEARTGSYYTATSFVEFGLKDQELLERFINARVVNWITGKKRILSGIKK